MTELKPCPNGCSSSGEIWNGEALDVCPVCHGNTVISPPKADARIAQARNDALEEAALWLDMIDEDCAKGIRALKTPEVK